MYEAQCTYVDDKYFDNHDYDDDTDADTDNDIGDDTDDDINTHILAWSVSPPIRFDSWAFASVFGDWFLIRGVWFLIRGF